MATSGCIVIGNGVTWSFGTTWWTEEVSEELEFDPVGVEALHVKTHNGAIVYSGQPTGSTEGRVIVKKKGGGTTMGDALNALKAIEVYVKRSSDDTVRIGWKWRGGVKLPAWNGHVSFEITGPGGVYLEGNTHNGPIQISEVDVVRVETHNGRVEVAGATGDVRAVTHNGPVVVDASDGLLYAETHNGSIRAGYAGSEITLFTHNGDVIADLQDCAHLEGEITTHNGGVEIVVGEATSADLQCETYNGRIRCDAPLSNIDLTKRKLSGTIGTGEGRLDVTTHNGGIRVRKGTG
jgi:hypothetical protein